MTAAKSLRRLAWVLAAVALAAVGGAIFGFWQTRIANQLRVKAEEQTRIAEKQLEQASWASFNQADLQIKRGEWQEGLAHLARAVQFNPENRIAGERFFQELILNSWRLGTPLAAFHHDDDVYSAVFSPDGSKVLTASVDKTAKLWDAVTAYSLAAFLRGGERTASNENRDSASRSILHQIELLSEYVSEREITEDGSLISSSRTLQLRNQLMK